MPYVTDVSDSVRKVHPIRRRRATSAADDAIKTTDTLSTRLFQWPDHAGTARLGAPAKGQTLHVLASSSCPLDILGPEGSIHVYQDHVGLAAQCLRRSPGTSPATLTRGSFATGVASIASSVYTWAPCPGDLVPSSPTSRLDKYATASRLQAEGLAAARAHNLARHFSLLLEGSHDSQEAVVALLRVEVEVWDEAIPVAPATPSRHSTRCRSRRGVAPLPQLCRGRPASVNRSRRKSLCGVRRCRARGTRDVRRWPG